MFSSCASWSTLKRWQPGSSFSEPSASTSMAFRKRCRSPGLMRAFTQIASMLVSPICLHRLLNSWCGPAGDLGLEVQRLRADRRASRHGPEDLELEAVGILGVEREADAVVGLADQRPRLGEPEPRASEIADLAHLPRRVVHARDALVRPRNPRLLEKAQVVVVLAAGNLHEGRVGILPLHLEPDD